MRLRDLPYDLPESALRTYSEATGRRGHVSLEIARECSALLDEAVLHEADGAERDAGEAARFRVRSRSARLDVTVLVRLRGLREAAVVVGITVRHYQPPAGGRRRRRRGEAMRAPARSGAPQCWIQSSSPPLPAAKEQGRWNQRACGATAT